LNEGRERETVYIYLSKEKEKKKDGREFALGKESTQI
jgi:hypothetical protein